MKKQVFLSLLGATVMFAACSQDAVIDRDIPRMDREVKFKTLTEKVGTRAASTTTTTIKDFFMYAITDTDGDYTTAGDRRMYQQGKVAPISTGSTTWRCENPLYWPTSGKIEFVSFSPAAPYGIATTPPTFTVSGNASVGDVYSGSMTLDYTVPSDVTKQEDLLLAYNKPMAVQTGTFTAVPIHFIHALARVQVKLQSGDGANYKVTKVSLINVEDHGTLKLDSTCIAPNVSGDPVWTLIPAAAKQTYTKVVDATAQSGAGYTDVLVGADAFMVMPQETGDAGTSTTPLTKPDAELTAGKLYIMVEVNAGTEDASKKEYYLPVFNPADRTKGLTFGMGRQYNLMLNVMMGGMSYDVIVEDYDDDKKGNDKEQEVVQ